MNEDLEKKINAMSEEQLLQYDNAASVAKFIGDCLGIGTVLIVLNFPTVFGIIIGGFVTLMLAHFTVALSKTRKYIDTKLEKYRR